VEGYPDPSLESLFGSRTRLLTMAVLANSDEPLTGYRVAKTAGLPRQKVYPEIRRGVASGLLKVTPTGYFLADPDVRTLLRKRVRVRWAAEWDRSRGKDAGRIGAELDQIFRSVRGLRLYNRSNRIPESARRELEREPAKNRILRAAGARASARKD
jgi:hypothetical protein